MSARWFRRPALAVLCTSVLITSAESHAHHGGMKMHEALDRVHRFESSLIKAQEAVLQSSKDVSSLLVGPHRSSIWSRVEALEHTAQVIHRHNEDDTRNHSYIMAWNPLSDLSETEYRDFLRSNPQFLDSHALGTKRSAKTSQRPGGGRHGLSVFGKDVHHTRSTGEAPLPKNWNWAEIQDGKFVAPIKNQGTCGSCWAFSAVSVIESRYAIEHDIPASSLSVEQVLSCSSSLDHLRSNYSREILLSSSQGCEGGMPFLAYEYMDRMNPHGIACDATYPYEMTTSVKETHCRALSSSDVAVKWAHDESSYVNVEQFSEEALQRAVLSGPVSANLDGESDGFRHYGSGIYDAQDCSNNGKVINHAVVVVGFGETDAGEKYWVVQNTWGTMWGERGFMRLARGKQFGKFGPCNLYMYSSYPMGLQSRRDADQKKPVCSMTGDTVAISAGKPLPTSSLLAIGTKPSVMVLLVVFLSIAGGLLAYIVTEQSHERKYRTSPQTYEDCYARWILPSREQLAAAIVKQRSDPARDVV